MKNIKLRSAREEEKNKCYKQMSGIHTQLPIITLNIGDLRSPVKRYRLEDWTEKQETSICSLQGIPLTTKDKHNLRLKGWKKNSKCTDLVNKRLLSL